VTVGFEGFACPSAYLEPKYPPIAGIARLPASLRRGPAAAPTAGRAVRKDIR
jgi:hypothetical protein